MSKVKRHNNYNTSNNTNNNIEEPNVENVIDTEEIVDEIAESIEESIEENLEELSPDLKETEVMRVQTNVLPREEVLRNRLKFIEGKIMKSHNSIEKCMLFEKYKAISNELKSLKGEYSPLEIKPIETYSSIAERPETPKESMFGTRGQVLGLEGMFMRL